MSKQIQMKTWVFASILAVSIAFASGFCWADATATPSDIQVNGVQVLMDPGFQNGARLITPTFPNGAKWPSCAPSIDNARGCNLIPFTANRGSSPAVPPAWSLAQWAAKYPLSPLSGSWQGSAYRWSSGSRWIEIAPDGSLTIAGNSISDLDGKYRTPGVGEKIDAPSILFQETLAKVPKSDMSDFRIDDKQPPLSDITALDFSVDAQLLYNTRSTLPGYNPVFHKSQFPLYIIVQNLNRRDKDFGNFIYLGLVIFDEQEDFASESMSATNSTAADSPGTKPKMWYHVPMKEFTSTRVGSFQPAHIQGDLLPYVKRALQYAYKNGFVTSNDLGSYKIAGINLGWELQGLNVSTMKLKNLSLRMNSINYPRSFEFNATTQGWTTSGSFSEVHISGGSWILRATGDNPWILSPRLQINADKVKKIVIRMANQRGQPQNSNIKISWRHDGEDYNPANASRLTGVSHSGGWHEYVIDLSKLPQWSGLITELRINPVEHGDGQPVGIDYIRFSQ